MTRSRKKVFEMSKMRGKHGYALVPLDGEWRARKLPQRVLYRHNINSYVWGGDGFIKASFTPCLLSLQWNKIIS